MIPGSLALLLLSSHNFERRTPDRRRHSAVAATSRGGGRGGRTAKRTNRKGGRKSEVDNLAQRLGLHQPPKSKKRPKSTAVSTKVQLQYATKGHAVLRGFFDESTVQMINDECLRISLVKHYRRGNRRLRFIWVGRMLTLLPRSLVRSKSVRTCLTAPQMSYHSCNFSTFGSATTLRRCDGSVFRRMLLRRLLYSSIASA